MKTSIVYFSRSGKTREISSKLGNLLNATVYEVTDDKNWKGFFGYMRGGFYAAKNKPVNITFNKELLDCEQLIVMSPLWAGGTAPAITSFLKEYPHNNTSVLITNDGSDVNKAFSKVKSLYPDIKHFYGITKKLKNEEQTLQNIKSELNQ